MGGFRNQWLARLWPGKSQAHLPAADAPASAGEITLPLQAGVPSRLEKEAAPVASKATARAPSPAATDVPAERQPIRPKHAAEALRSTLVERPGFHDQADGSRPQSFTGAEAAWPVPAGPMSLAVERPSEPSVPIRPRFRYPIPLLWVLDDGQPTGELVRMRSSRLLIGRTEGDVRVVHDLGISDPHAQLAWERDGDEPVVMLRDLSSIGGTYARVERARVRNGRRIHLGGRRYRLEQSDEGSFLVEQTADGDASIFPLVSDEVWIGRDPRSCQVVFSDDLMISPRHARMVLDGKRRWVIENAESRNGVWVEISELPITSVAEFMMGEQRFWLCLNKPVSCRIADLPAR